MTAKDFSREGTKEMPGTLRCSRYELSKKGSKKEGRREGGRAFSEVEPLGFTRPPKGQTP